jgi:hypothetical protein
MILKKINNLFEKDHTQKLLFASLGFITVFLIVFLFYFIGTKVAGIKDNYISLFCTNTI